MTNSGISSGLISLPLFILSIVYERVIMSDAIQKTAIDTIRTLSMDGVQAANSGHPGTPMALAPAAYLVYNEFLNYNPQQPTWQGRDRFILSAGHASMLLYSMIHLTGVTEPGEPSKPAVTLDDLKNFRQLDSKCPGHPEFGHTWGVEMTTGPLGQGVATSVGVAMGQKFLAAKYNRDGFKLFDSNIYVVCGDGDLMEGVASEAASLGGHLGLDNLCWIYDDNKITIEGETDLAFTEDVAARFTSYGWNVIQAGDVNNLETLRDALENFKKTTGKPTLIIIQTEIGYGAPTLAGTHTAHGAPLGDAEIKATKEAYGWEKPDETFFIPDGVMEHFDAGIGERGAKAYDAWNALFASYCEKFAQEGGELKKIFAGELPETWDQDVVPFAADAKGLASRASSGKVLNQIADNFPWLIGGSADLAPSNKSDIASETSFQKDNYGGRNLHFGIRENAMGSIVNGLALCGLKSYGATFFVFSDYLRPAMRQAAIMGLPIFYILTHDSIGVGEDGPTHQPIEHLAACRSIPGMYVFRPADANEVAESYKTVMQLTSNPSCMVLTRQNLPTVDRNEYASAEGTERGGYVLADCDGKPELLLVATGSEVSLCLEAKKVLDAKGKKVRVVSIPCLDLFQEQDADYRDAVLPQGSMRLIVEAGIKQGWGEYLICPKCEFLGMEGFGASAPAGQLFEHFGFSVENVVKKAEAILA